MPAKLSVGMYLLLSRLAAWLLQKTAVAVLIVVLGLSAYALFLYVQEQATSEERRAEWARTLQAEKDRLVELKTAVEQRMQSFQADLAVQKERIDRAERILQALRDLESWWDRWFGNPEQQRKNAEQAAKVAQWKKESMLKLPEIERLLAQATGERDGLTLSLSRVEDQLIEAGRTSKVAHYIREAWHRTRWYVALALATFLFGPTLWKLTLYYGVAPLISRSRPLKFSPGNGVQPEVGASHVSVDVALWPGEQIRVKEKYLQASDEGLVRRTRFLLDWRIPFTSLACGLSELVEMRNTTAGADYRVTFSNADDPHMELAVAHVPAGGSLILRPSFLAGVITRIDEPLRIRRRWALWRWLSWVTFQFRFFEFQGPCRLIVAGTRGVRAERLVDREGQPRAARRTNQDATIGFTPNLEYRPIRAETFWAYYRDMNPLFDDLFAGPGVFICQETAHASASAQAAGRFWSTVWNGLLKVFGM